MTLRPEIPASSTSPRSIRRGEFHPPGRSRTALESAKLELSGRLKEAEARLPAALATVYRFVLVPAKNKTLRCFDLGISGYSGKTTLSNRVAEKLTDEQQILDKLDPSILIGDRFGLWPEDRDVINVKTLADYFTQLTHLPRLRNAAVLPDCLSKGVHRSLFAYALGDGEKKEFDTILFSTTRQSVHPSARSLRQRGSCAPPWRRR